MAIKKKFLRTIATLLAVLMVAGMIPVNALALDSLTPEMLDMLDYSNSPSTTITYHTDYGSTPATVTGIGYVFMSEHLPTMYFSGMIFKGWYYDKDFTRAASTSDYLKGDISLYAKWTPAMGFDYYEKNGVIYITSIFMMIGAQPGDRTILPTSINGISTYVFENFRVGIDDVFHPVVYGGTYEELVNAALDSSAAVAYLSSPFQSGAQCPYTALTTDIPCLNEITFDLNGVIPTYTERHFTGDKYSSPFLSLDSGVTVDSWITDDNVYQESISNFTATESVTYHALINYNYVFDKDDKTVTDFRVCGFRGAVYIKEYFGHDQQVIVPVYVKIRDKKIPITSIGIPFSVMEIYEPSNNPTFSIPYDDPYYTPVYCPAPIKNAIVGGKVFPDSTDMVIVTQNTVTDVTNSGGIRNLFFDCANTNLANPFSQYSDLNSWSYATDSNGTTVTGCDETALGLNLWNSSDMAIPFYMGGKTVYQLGNGTDPIFSVQKETVIIPTSVTSIKPNALNNINVIDYDGTLEEYKTIQGYGNINASTTQLHLKYPVVFMYNLDGFEDETVYVKYGSKVSVPDTPSADHYIFNGWYTSPSLSTPYDFSHEITWDEFVYASWTPLYDVTLPAAPEGFSISTDSTSPVEKGGNFFFTISPEPGYNVSDLVVRTNGSVIIDYDNYDGTVTYGIYGIYDNKVVTIANTVDTWEYELTNNGTAVSVTKYNGAQASVVVPANINGLPVTSIGSGAFMDNTYAEEIALPSTVTSIDSYAFKGCSNLTEVTGTGNVTQIGEYAFENCTSLDSISLASVTSFGNSSFKNCSSLSAVNNSCAVYFGQSAFKDSGVSGFSICHDVESIGSEALNNGTAAIAFDGSLKSWNALTSGKNAVNNSQTVTFTWATVSFDTGNRCAAPADIEIEKGDSAVLPQSLETDKYNFYGWCSDSACSVSVQSPVQISDDTVFYADLREIISYLDENGDVQSRDDCISIDNFGGTVTLSSGWYVVNSSAFISGRITIDGNVNIILCDNSTFYNSSGISVNEGNSLSFYAQSNSNNMGFYSSSGNDYGACIGGDRDTDSGTINIYGGHFYLHGQFYSTCIGGGRNGDAGPILIKGGVIDATALADGACIGAGDNGNASSITITGGSMELDAYGIHSVGIGASNGNGGNISITGGNISILATGTGTVGVGSTGYDTATNTVLGYSSTGDSYLIPSYRGSLTFADGCNFVCSDTSPVIQATTDNLKGNVIIPYEGIFINVSICNGSETLQTYTVAQGSYIPEPETPAANSFSEFAGWYDEATGTPFAFDAPVQEDTVIIAKWTEPYSDYTVYSGTEGANSDENYDALFDNDPDSKWCVTDFSGFATTEFKSEDLIVPVGYILTTGGDTYDYPERNPRSWTVEAKEYYGDEWTVISSVSEDDPAVLEGENLEEYLFEINNTGNNAYHFFRFTVDGIVDGECFQLSEFRFVAKAVIDAPVYTVSFDANGGSGTMNPVQIEDGDYLPESTFTAPSEKFHLGWTVDSTDYPLSSRVSLRQDTTAYALWGDYFTVTIVENGGEYAVMNYDYEITVEENGTITLPPANYISPPAQKVFDCWMIGGEEYAPGDTITITSDTVITPVWRDADAWERLDSDFYDPFIDIIVLSENVVAPKYSLPLLVPEGRTVTLDLNGYTIDRALTEETVNGYVIEVSGELTLIDSSESKTGKITGGFNNDEGGGVVVDEDGTFIFESGTITGNRAAYGSGVETYGNFIMNGGIITGNYATESSAGVEAFYSSSNFEVSGCPIITGNYTIFTDEDDNVILRDSNVYYFTNFYVDSLDEGAIIGLCNADIYTFAETSSENIDCLNAFVSDYPNLLSVAYSEGGTAYGHFEETNESIIDDKLDHYGNSLTLNGDIGVNYYICIVNPSVGTYASFEVDGNTVDVPINFADYCAVNGRRYFKFSCNVSAAQIGKDIICTIHSDDYSYEFDAYTVQDYLSLAGSGAIQASEKLVKLCKAIATYGYYANESFDYDEDLEMGSMFDSTLLDGITAASLAGEQAQISDTEFGVDYYGSSLLLRTKTAIRHYFTLSAGQSIGDFSFVLGEGEDAEELTPVKNGNMYYVEIPNIPSPLLRNAYTVCVLDGDGNTVNTWTYSAMSYVYKALTAENPDPELVNTVKALVAYADAAADYFLAPIEG